MERIAILWRLKNWSSCICKTFFSLFFPERCIICDSLEIFHKEEAFICASCLEKLSFLDEVKTCKRCGSPIANEGNFCETCLTHERYFDIARAALPYHRAVRHAVLLYKFGGRRDLCRGFSALISSTAKKLLGEVAFDMVVYPPMSKKAYDERGYNQAELLAERISKALSVSLCRDAFLKIKDTPKQSTLSYRERFLNVKDAYRLNLPKRVFKGKKILLIDDVLTTGATADALSGLLKGAKASYVAVCTLASTEKDKFDKLSDVKIDDVIF